MWIFSSSLSLLITLPLFTGGEFALIKVWNSYPLPYPVVGPLLAVGLWLLTLLFAQRQYDNWRYELRQHDLVLNWGVWWQTRRCIALDRIQHVDINSGPLDRRFGLVQMSIHTAGMAGGIGSIPGLKPDTAEHLREILLSHRSGDA